MTHEQILLVKNSWKHFGRMDPTILGDVFYSKLFSDSPGLRKMFPADMTDQYRKLAEMLNMIVARLENPAELNEEIYAVSIRHHKYGVRPGHYKLVGRALLWTLRHGSGRDWNEKLRDAWIICYSFVAEKMMTAS